MPLRWDSCVRRPGAAGARFRQQGVLSGAGDPGLRRSSESSEFRRPGRDTGRPRLVRSVARQASTSSSLSRSDVSGHF
eukprot:766058-Hanusia_phi.AAC.5